MPPSRQGLYILCLGLDINGWFVAIACICDIFDDVHKKNDSIEVLEFK